MVESTPNILDLFPAYEATIGIEVHVQLKTNTKIFCSCPNIFGIAPNHNICPICAGYPGTLPMLNKKVIEYAVMAGLATNCRISPTSEFSRKHYYYPDLPKNYQITQGAVAICHDGWVPTERLDGSIKKIGIGRIHMEEDAGKTIHGDDGKSLVDLNRAGTPLLETVSCPDIANAHEAKVYLMNLRSIMQYLGISDVNMEEGSFRADINISVKKKGVVKLGTRAEVKNVNSFKFIVQAINYEIERQIDILESGGVVRQETRLWNEKDQKTMFMRSKTDADDYRYFTEPDLPAVVIDDAFLDRVRALIPELPFAKKERFMAELGLSEYDADGLVQDRALSAYFEDACAIYNKPKLMVNWILRDVLGYLNGKKISLSESPITADMIAGLVQLIDTDVINTKVAQEVFAEMAATGKSPAAIVKEKGLEQVSDTGALEAICQKIVESNPDVVEKYRAGNQRMFGFFVGLAMKESGGKGNPKIMTEIFQRLLA
ncbi:MAG: aspartyl-tRNA(Asn)/glutamyl-tRNA(Gln) amidotransferase subunit [Candidatus Dependentiae bacterium]|nr:aspartyl-tRNA(Asn)/glutamyl-tRNA(Gln) amidotransferase subunit [Candidatus Dependentiae bacterium]